MSHGGRPPSGCTIVTPAALRTAVQTEERQDARRAAAQREAAAELSLPHGSGPRVSLHGPVEQRFDGKPGNAKRTRVPCLPSATVVLTA